MVKNSILIGSLCLLVAACGSVHQQPQKVETPRAQTVTMMAQSDATELKAEVGGTILKIDTTQDAVGGNKPTVTKELKYLGLTPGGRIKLRILSNAPAAAGPVDFEQDPGAVYTLEKLKVEFIEAQPSWVRYRISTAGG
jgi:hypothetical protein